jgi:hypothetical protein
MSNMSTKLVDKFPYLQILGPRNLRISPNITLRRHLGTNTLSPEVRSIAFAKGGKRSREYQFHRIISAIERRGHN